MEQLRLVSVESETNKAPAPAGPERSLEWIRRIRCILERSEIQNLRRAG